MRVLLNLKTCQQRYGSRPSRDVTFQRVIIDHIQNVVFENKSLFLKETHMFLCCACTVQRMLTTDTIFE